MVSYTCNARTYCASRGDACCPTVSVTNACIMWADRLQVASEVLRISGIYAMPLRCIAFHTGMDKGTVLKSSERFTASKKIYSRSVQWCPLVCGLFPALENTGYSAP